MGKRDGYNKQKTRIHCPVPKYLRNHVRYRM